MNYLRWNISRVYRKINSLQYQWRKSTSLNRFTVVASDRRVGLDDFYLFKGRLRINGWVVPTDAVVGFLVDLGDLILKYHFSPIKSLDLEERYGSQGSRARFTIEVPVKPHQERPDIALWCLLTQKRIFRVDVPPGEINNPDPEKCLFQEFLHKVGALTSGRVLEIGSRNRSNLIRKGLVPDHLEYCGLDITAGENVDVVGDAHKLSSCFTAEHFDAIFSVAVFEHLMMPWLVAVEMNKVMKVGALAFVHSHHAFPLHEEPWDFWRYTDRAWIGLFNAYSGFEILGTSMGYPAYVVPRSLDDVTCKMQYGRAFLNSSVLVRKISSTKLSWQADPSAVHATTYSH